MSEREKLVTPEVVEAAFLAEIKSYYSDHWNKYRGPPPSESEAQDLINGVIRRLFGP